MSAAADDATSDLCDPCTPTCAHRSRCIQVRWLFGGMVFGASFPVIGWFAAMSAPAVDGLLAAHRAQPVLYIVDLAPLVLGVTGFAIGHFHSRLIKIRHSIEQTVCARTAALEQALRDLSATQAEKDRFVVAVSHELRTPLTSVVGLAHALVESGGDISAAERDELLDLIVRESEEVASIVEDLLVAARSESGELAIGCEVLRLDEEVSAVLEVCESNVKPVRLEPAAVVGDPVRIHQIVRNLITNAARYGGDAVTVEVMATSTHGVLSVGDDGPGVPEARLDRIFEAFGTAHQDPARTESVGLGLTVSRNLARLMGGDVTYRRSGNWTHFDLTLPLASTGAGSATSVPKVARAGDDAPSVRKGSPDAVATR